MIFNNLIIKQLLIPLFLVLFINTLHSQSKILLNDKAEILLKSKPVKKEFSFAVMGDPHFNDDEIYEQIFPNILGKVYNLDTKPEFVIILGDGVENGSSFQYYSYYEYLSSWMDSTGIPVFNLPGNHDFENFSAFLNYLSYIDQDLDYYFDYGENRFVMINNVNSITSSNYYITSNQIDTVNQWLLDFHGKKFAFAHIPLIRDFYSSGLDNYGFEELLNTFEAQDVSAYFNGHIHDYCRLFNNNICHINSGGAGGSLLGTYNPPLYYNSYHWLLIKFDACNGVYSEMHRYPQGRDSISQLYDFQIANQLNIFADVNSISCSGEEDGSINIIVTGGNGEYNYLWSNSETNSSINSLQAGTYSVTISDSTACYSEKTFTITEPEEIYAVSIIAPDTNNQCVASVSINVSGGTAPYSFIWSEPNANNCNVLSNLCENNYSVTITDANNCIKEYQFYINNVYTNIKDFSLQNEFKIWPNPTSDNIKLYLPNIKNEFIELSIYNTLGNLVYSDNVYITNNNSINLNLKNYPKGFYLLKIYSADNKHITAKIIIR